MAEAQDAPGALQGQVGPDTLEEQGANPDTTGVVVDNRTDLPDAEVMQAIKAHWVETAAMQYGQPSTFQLYATNQGSNMLTRSPFRVPSNVIEEIKLARMVAETDDDVVAIIGSCLSTAYGDGMRNQHPDEKTLQMFNRIGRDMHLDNRFKEMHREYLIAGQVNTLSLFTRSRLNFTPSGTDERIQEQLSTPLIGILPAENIRVVSNDIFGTGELAYDPPDHKLKEWLTEFFNKRTTPARKHQMATEEPVTAAIFTRQIEVPWNDTDLFTQGKTLYILNPRMVHRTCMPKGASAYPRPPITSNFALLEAKRLLNIMDYSLLQGGTNYIVVARQGSDKLPAQQPEIDNLTEVVRNASRTGVLVGDHRLSVDIITPELKELLNAEKRKLIGRKLAMAILRIPEQVTGDAGTEGAKQESEFTARTVTADRRDIRRHVERTTYEEIAQRNVRVFPKGPPSIWFPKIILSGVADFFTSVLKARDRGDIPRSYAVELLGYDYDAAVSQREREIERGDDDIMIPGSVPFSGDGQPADGGGDGRPPGSSSNNGRPGSAPAVDPAQRQRVAQPRVRRPRGEPVRSVWDDSHQATMRIGELTAAVLDEFEGVEVGRVTTIEREAVEQSELLQRGPVAVVPVNVEYSVGEIRAFRLQEGLSMIVGQRSDGALVARALCFREPQFDLTTALETTSRWGFITEFEAVEEARLVTPDPAAPTISEVIAQAMQDPTAMAAVGAVIQDVFAKLQPNIEIHMPGQAPQPVIDPPAAD